MQQAVSNGLSIMERWIVLILFLLFQISPTRQSGITSRISSQPPAGLRRNSVEVFRNAEPFAAFPDKQLKTGLAAGFLDHSHPPEMLGM